MGADTFMDLTSYKWKRSKDVVSMIEGRFVVKLRESDNSMITKASITERIKQVEKDFKKENISLKLDVHLNTEGVSSVSSSAGPGTSADSSSGASSGSSPGSGAGAGSSAGAGPSASPN